MDQALFEAYLKILREEAKIIRQLTDLEQRKLADVRADNVKGVDDCIRQEQVLSLSLRGQEQRRENALAAMGLKSIPLSGLVAHAPDALRMETVAVANDLTAAYETYRSASGAARSALERVLHQVDRMLAAAKQEAPQARPAAHPRQRVAEEPPVGGHGADFKA